MNEADNIEYKGYNIKIYNDETAENPRNWDNLGKMICFHKRYSLGDNLNLSDKDFNSWEELYNHIKTTLKGYIILPLYLYDHSGLSIKIGSFKGLLPQGHAEFDSGQIGFIFVTKQDILENFGVKTITSKIKNKTIEVLTSEVETYSQYVNGECYCYTIEDSEGNNIDSLSGFYGYDFEQNGLLTKAKSSIDYHIKSKNIAKTKKVKTLIKNKVDLNVREKIVSNF